MTVRAAPPSATTQAADADLAALPHERPVASDIHAGEPAASPDSSEASRQEPGEDFFKTAFLRVRGVPTEQVAPEAQPAGDKPDQGAAAPAGETKETQDKPADGGAQAPPSSREPNQP